MTEARNPFDSCSEQYSKFRPPYPEALIDFVHGLTHTRLVDVGAGTGKASSAFVLRGLHVISIEPSLSMIRQGLRSDSDLRYVCASAEQLPLSSSSADTVISAQAFHWFDAALALREFHRILSPGGHICLFWNTRNNDHPAPKLFDALIRKWNPGHDPAYRGKDWAQLFPAVEHRRFHQTIPMTIDDWIGLSRSISYVQSMDESRLRHFEDELREGLSRLDATAAVYTTDLWSARV